MTMNVKLGPDQPASLMKTNVSIVKSATNQLPKNATKNKRKKSSLSKIYLSTTSSMIVIA